MTEFRPSTDIDVLLGIIKKLRSPLGCPWDREQTSASLISFILEEAYEVADAIESGQGYKICEELGDLLLQIVFRSQIAEEQGQFDFGDVVLAITEKLIRRHPHIFADAEAETPGEVSEIWAKVKAEERGNSQRQDVPPLPGLILLDKLARRVDPSVVSDSLIRQLMALAEVARAQGSSLEAKIRWFYANSWQGGRNLPGDGE